MLPRLLLMPFVSFERRVRMFLEVMGSPGYPPSVEDIERFGLLIGEFKHDQRAPDALSEAEIARLTAPTAVLYGDRR